MTSGLPREITMKNTYVRAALAKSLRSIVESVREVIETTPPELTGDVLKNGITLCGGGALAVLERPGCRVHALFFPKLILDSVPSNRRRMLTVWRRMTSSAITSTTAMGSAPRRPASHA